MLTSRTTYPALVASLLTLLVCAGGQAPAEARTSARTSRALALTATSSGTTVAVSRWGLTLNGSTLFLEVCSNRSVSGPDPAVKRVVLVTHGDERNACGAAGSVVEAARLAGKEAETLVVAPHFLTDTDVAADPTAAASTLYWSSSGWKTGASSLTSPYTRPWVVSSFEATDRLIAFLENGERFPNVSQVLIAGHSAGGQFVNRYAAGTASPAADPVAVTRRYVVANPSSYLYWNATRRIAGTWRLLSSSEVASCPGYDTYKYGLAKRTGYMAATDATTLATRYANSRVTYLLGALDTDLSDSSLDTGCAANLQGPTRLDRGLRYSEHLGRVFSPVVTERHRTVVVPGVGHTARGMFTSQEGQQALFPTAAS
jgi:hypothetical protein